MSNKLKWYPILLIGLVLILASSVVACGEPVPTPTPTPVTTPAPTPTLTPTPTPTPELTKGNLNVYFIDVGQGDAILLDQGTTEVLIDGGTGSVNVANYIKPYVDGPIEEVIATHMDADHIGGLTTVLNMFKVLNVWDNGDTSTSVTYKSFKTAILSNGAIEHIGRRGDTILADSLSFKVLNPVSTTGTSNNNSIVLRLDYSEVSFQFEGDAEQEAEASMLAAGLISHVDILKVGHHGSRTSSSPAFLAVVKPAVAIYMAGVGNSYGHPHQETIAALQKIGAQIYGTDVNGTIVVTSDGKSFSVQPKIHGERAPPVVAPEPAKFILSNLSISPSEVKAGESVTISATVTNSGGSSGSNTTILKINGSQVETKSVTLNAAESQVVTFTVIKESAGTYTVELGGLAGTFTVTQVVTPGPTQVLFLEIVSVTSPIGQGYTATLKAKTLPGAQCTIAVYYKSGKSTASGLYPKEADSQGNVSWSWKVGTRTTPGSWPIVVTASLDGETVSKTTNFTVY